MPSQSEGASPVMLEVLGRLFASSLLNGFYLVGGTALALQLGHRRSVDIDLFTHTPFDSQEIADWLAGQMAARELESGKNLVRCFIAGVKVDILAHQYPLLEPVQDCGVIRTASLPDIAAMKLNAVANRGARKDFWDFAALLDRYSASEILDFYSGKYRAANRWAAIKSLVYFEDADADDAPIEDFTGMTWDIVKAKIRLATTKLLEP